VTGVQTCALPISTRDGRSAAIRGGCPSLIVQGRYQSVKTDRSGIQDEEDIPQLDRIIFEPESNYRCLTFGVLESFELKLGQLGTKRL
jgi:hypothetical protein